MINLKFLAVVALGTTLAGCAMRTKVLDVAAVSMTKSSLNEGETLKETGPVSGQFCADTFGDKGSIGLIDESVKMAQSQSGVDFILNAAFWNEGQCMVVEGTGAKIAGGGTSVVPASPAKKK
jgi:hypothetical protein